MKPDVLVGTFLAGIDGRAARDQLDTNRIFAVADPVGSGRVASLAQPGGNITGFATSEEAIGAKWLELLKEVSPRMARVAVIRTPATPSAGAFLITAVEAAASSMGVRVTVLGVRDLPEIERGFEMLARESMEGLIVMPDPVNSIHHVRIIELAGQAPIADNLPIPLLRRRRRLISYGANSADMWWRAASYVDRILRGAKPANLPVQNPTRYDLIINLKTAKALGLAIPPALLARADEVIE